MANKAFNLKNKPDPIDIEQQPGWLARANAIINDQSVSIESKQERMNILVTEVAPNMTGDFRRELLRMARDIGLKVNPFAKEEADFLKQKFPDPTYTYPGLITIGLTLLAGPSGDGKSCFALQLMKEIEHDETSFLTGQRCRSHEMLYCQLEDGLRPLQRRMELQGWKHAKHVTTFDQEDFADKIGLLGTERGITNLQQACQYFKLVVIDTMLDGLGGVKLNNYEVMSPLLAKIKKAALENESTVLIIHHPNKAFRYEEGDIINVSGSYAIESKSDTRLNYKAKGNGYQRVLTVRQRNETNSQKMLEFDPKTLLASCKGEYKEVMRTGNQTEIYNLLKDEGPMRVIDIARSLEKERDDVFYSIKRLTKDKLIEQIEGKKYKVCDTDVNFD
ncbi:MAG: AAA family ATPase [Caldiserica bacterium]|nr:AAA family ATPase [Caldisericota bacterium]